eukprot:COSAG01_NODE_20040_length_974_cov_1.698286_2_plen_245_part_01
MMFAHQHDVEFEPYQRREHLVKAMIAQVCRRGGCALRESRVIHTARGVPAALCTDGRHLIFGSMRFPVPAEARQLQAVLATQYGVTLFILDVESGQDISDQVFEKIEQADTFLVFGTRHYGENTGNPASTYREAKFAQSAGKRILLIQMMPWEEKFDHLTARVLFGMNRLTLDWQLGSPMPSDLPAQIVRALHLDDGTAVVPSPSPLTADPTEPEPELEPELEPEDEPEPELLRRNVSSPKMLGA